MSGDMMKRSRVSIARSSIKPEVFRSTDRQLQSSGDADSRPKIEPDLLACESSKASLKAWKRRVVKFSILSNNSVLSPSRVAI
jgi:hypothetical protein